MKNYTTPPACYRSAPVRKLTSAERANDVHRVNVDLAREITREIANDLEAQYLLDESIRLYNESR